MIRRMMKDIRAWWLCTIRHEHQASFPDRKHFNPEPFLCLRCGRKMMGLWINGRFYQDVLSIERVKTALKKLDEIVPAPEQSQTPHVVVDEREGAFQCMHCGAKEKFALPMTMKAFSYQGQRFQNEHKDCTEPTSAGNKQMLKDIWRRFADWAKRTPKQYLIRKRH